MSARDVRVGTEIRLGRGANPRIEGALEGALGLAGGSNVSYRLSLTDDDHQVDWLLDTPFAESGPALSPDGRWLSYQSDETGQVEVYVTSFPNVEGARLVSQGGGRWSKWSPSGDELFYVQPGPPARLMAVSNETVDGSSAFRFGDPEAILNFPYFLGAGRTYDVAPDGRFLVVKPGPVLEPAIPPQVILVEHWFEEVKRLVLTN